MTERFNWDNIPSPGKKSLKKKLGEKNTSDGDNSNISQIQSNKGKYNYTVDMTEKPQDPGTVNELINEINQKKAEMLNRAIRNPVSVGKIG